MCQISNFVITPCFFAEMRNETVERMDLFSVKFEMVENPDEGINNFEIRKGRLLGACQSVDNCRLFVGGIPKTKKRDEIMEEMKKVTEGKNRENYYFHNCLSQFVKQRIICSAFTDIYLGLIFPFEASRPFPFF